MYQVNTTTFPAVETVPAQSMQIVPFASQVLFQMCLSGIQVVVMLVLFRL